MNTISRHGGFARLFAILAVAALVSCDFNGPWSFYPEETEIYAGVYTYGYIVEGESPRVCFSKMYQLEEASAENFAFYDSAYVTVTGPFNHAEAGSSKRDTFSLVLDAEMKNPKCFAASYIFSADGVNYFSAGVPGGTYTLRAVFKWDSAGHDVTSEYLADATIPTGFDIRGVDVPLKGGEYEWHDLDLGDEWRYRSTTDAFVYGPERLEVEFLEYPDDMNLYKIVPEYNETVGGILMSMEYDVLDGGESMNTTINHMLEGLKEANDVGYRGAAIHDGLEGRVNLGFEENNFVAGLNMLDTLFLPNMNLPLGNVKLHILATDDAYRTYRRYVLGAIDDPRVVPASNIENGMGVFSGMVRRTIPLKVAGTGVGYPAIAWYDCVNGKGLSDDSWDSRTCRLYQDVACSGADEYFNGDEGELYELNEHAHEYVYGFYSGGFVAAEACYASAVKFAMMLDEESWSVFLPSGIDAGDKSEAYGDGLKRYCVASNFESNHIANCSSMKFDCLESLEKTVCKEYLWQWCADRNWDIEKYEQCGSGLVSRFYIEEQQSSILEKAVRGWCERYGSDPQCNRDEEK